MLVLVNGRPGIGVFFGFFKVLSFWMVALAGVGSRNIG